MKLCFIAHSEIPFYPFYLMSSPCVSAADPPLGFWMAEWCLRVCDIIRREPSVRVLVRSRDFTYVGALRIVLTRNRQAFHVSLFISLFSLPSIVYIAISNFLIISNRATMNFLELIHSHLG